MITHDYDEKTETLLVSEDGKETFRCEGISEEKVKYVLESCLFKTKEGTHVGFDAKTDGFVDKTEVYQELVATPRLIDPEDCPTKDCPMREEGK